MEWITSCGVLLIINVNRPGRRERDKKRVKERQKGRETEREREREREKNTHQPNR